MSTALKYAARLVSVASALVWSILRAQEVVPSQQHQQAAAACAGCLGTSQCDSPHPVTFFNHCAAHCAVTCAKLRANTIASWQAELLAHDSFALSSLRPT
eukprot:2184-Heterococcus_DN1.PRE.5